MPTRSEFEAVVATFGNDIRVRFSSPGATGEPEEQLRSPIERLFVESGPTILGIADAVVMIGESTISSLHTRPDFAVTVGSVLVGFVELKAPGKGADPRLFTDRHDREQWEKLKALPNLIYSDGNNFSRWCSGEIAGEIVSFRGDLRSTGSRAHEPDGLATMIAAFLTWQPIPPRSAQDLAHLSARLCRLLRDEVEEQLVNRNETLTTLATDWRKLLFPDASDKRFADGYAQAITFGLLMARAKGIRLAEGLDAVARELSASSTLIGAALRLLTEGESSRSLLKTSLGTMTRVLDVVDWESLGHGQPESWLYFYEEFLEIYDSDLRKMTGSYYTPPEVVRSMVSLVDQALKQPGFDEPAGISSPAVTIIDPATGTGTFVLGVLRQIAEFVRQDQGPGAVAEAVRAAAERLIAFEIQIGPFAVAQLRLLAEILALCGPGPNRGVRMFVADTLGNPNDEEGWIPGLLAPIAQSRKDANRVKREQPITVVLGNPPYKEKAKGRGGWVEDGGQERAPLLDWMPPKAWKLGPHAKHLRNLYVYFWRWATWKVFDYGPGDHTGIVCYITVAGFLAGPGFQKMRQDLRQKCDDIWVIDCSPEGLQPDVRTRIFQGVQQPVCIVIASRSRHCDVTIPAKVRFVALPLGTREDKFLSLSRISLQSEEWIECSSDWRAPFLPTGSASWNDFPELERLFVYSGSGVMPGRTWVIAPDKISLKTRWRKLVEAAPSEKSRLFHPHLVDGQPGDRHVDRVIEKPLHGFPRSSKPVSQEQGDCVEPIPYSVRSLDRQWIIPDIRLINRPNPTIWKSRSESQIYLTMLTRTIPTVGPAIGISALVPDMDHYNGRGGRVVSLWQDEKSEISNPRPELLRFLSASYGSQIAPVDVLAYLAGILAHPGFLKKYSQVFVTPGIRLPITSDQDLFWETVEVGRRAIWLHTYGERMSDTNLGRPKGPPRLPGDKRPLVSADGAIANGPGSMPDIIRHDAETSRLYLGDGWVDNVPLSTWEYHISGKRVLTQWFSSRKRDRTRPLIGDRREPSALGAIQPSGWISEYTTELLNLLNIIGLLVELEPIQSELLERVGASPKFTNSQLENVGVFVEVTPYDGSDPHQTLNLFASDEG